MTIDRKKAKGAFLKYVENYDHKNPKIKLKIDHTEKVSALCEVIAKSIGLSNADVDLAWMIGLLHDIGRFEQLRQYGTFHDACSIDHAVFGAKLLFDRGMINEYLEDHSEDYILKTAIRLHSCYRLPEGLDERTEMFCNIIRDADKIDILRVNAQIPIEDIYDVTTEELKNSWISPKVMQSFMEEHATLRILKKTPADYIVGHISLIYELIYPVSIALTNHQGYLQRLLAIQFNNPKTQEQFQIIKERIETFIDKCTQKGNAVLHL